MGKQQRHCQCGAAKLLEVYCRSDYCQHNSPLGRTHVVPQPVSIRETYTWRLVGTHSRHKSSTRNFIPLTRYIVELYNLFFFANGTIGSVNSKAKLKKVWRRILHIFGASRSQGLPFRRCFLAAAAVSLSFVLNHNLHPFEQLELLYNYCCVSCSCSSQGS